MRADFAYPNVGLIKKRKKNVLCGLHHGFVTSQAKFSNHCAILVPASQVQEETSVLDSEKSSLQSKSAITRKGARSIEA
ncbi:hypothetical protein SK128_023706 [Halocaridina rubra]|uniref:Uncharacterized protein n=1 Tax=Halocaridina rubra TaxID=373956 RepID=A0AAN8WF89_HALRR